MNICIEYKRRTAKEWFDAVMKKKSANDSEEKDELNENKLASKFYFMFLF